MIHRDVKPSNLLVDGRGFVWVADFGSARRMADPGLTQHDSLLGTPRYMSPEQARPGPIDGRSDLFSLGFDPLRAPDPAASVRRSKRGGAHRADREPGTSLAPNIRPQDPCATSKRLS